MSELIYTNIKANSFKVWGFDTYTDELTKEEVVTSYRGRIGLPKEKLNKYIKRFPNTETALKYIKNKINKRKEKRYKTISASKYFEMVEIKMPLSSITRFIEREGNNI
ncbi:MAG: hypothetical protein GY830_07785 [Bacteroidetes bacterium]|nr:hypothetical protein [Bacteroidota bacterium]